jgi:hypothetical protein
MSHSPPVELTESFCSYCGRPSSDSLHRTIRVCVRCHLGMVLRAPPGQAPRVRDAFVIVDQKLTVQAISHRAERVLGVDEPDGVHTLLDDLLQPAGCDLDRRDIALLLMLAVTGSPPPDRLELQAVNEPQRRFRARVTSCGQPLAALLVLAPQVTTSGKATARA